MPKAAHKVLKLVASKWFATNDENHVAAFKMAIFKSFSNIPLTRTHIFMLSPVLPTYTVHPYHISFNYFKNTAPDFVQNYFENINYINQSRMNKFVLL